jgi:hypothetical protein
VNNISEFDSIKTLRSFRRLTPRQQRFVLGLMLTGSPVAAVIGAFNVRDFQTARVMASGYMRKRKITQCLAEIAPSVVRDVLLRDIERAIRSKRISQPEADLLRLRAQMLGLTEPKQTEARSGAA